MTIKVFLFAALAASFLACAQSASPPPSPTTGQAPAAGQSAPATAPGAQTPSVQTPPAAAGSQLAPPGDVQKPASAAQAAPAPAPPAATTGAEPPTGAASAPALDAAKPAASAKPVPEFREITIPAGTALSVRLVTPLASDQSAVEDEVRGRLTAPIVIRGVTAVPSNAEVIGTVREVHRSGRVKGRASIAFQFDRLLARDDSHTILTPRITREAATKRSDDVKKGAIGGAAGAIVGGIIGGGTGAAVGAGVGGAGAVMATRGQELELPAGTTVRTTLQESIKVVVPVSKEGTQPK